METPRPTLDDVRAARERLGERVRTTPLWRWSGREIAALAGADTDVLLKLELFQVTGTFKPRGALLNALSLDDRARERGLTAVSAGNHAIAVAFAAHQLGSSAKVVMPKKANPARVATCRAWGAEVVLVEDVHQAFAEVERIRDEEGRTFIHPFEGELTTLGTATLGWEIDQQADDLDAVVVPIGGGGLAAGIACAIKEARPACAVYGVEPTGADTMHRSFAAGAAQKAERLDTIADSLAAPHAGEASFALCRRYLDDVVLVDDDALRRAMALLFREMKLAVEPAGAAATAALVGPLAERLRGKRVALVVCGSNTDLATFARLAAVDT